MIELIIIDAVIDTGVDLTEDWLPDNQSFDIDYDNKWDDERWDHECEIWENDL